MHDYKKNILNIDSMKPNLLFSSCGVGAHSKDILHLLVAHEHNVTRNIPSESFAAGRAGEGTAVSPELGEGVDFCDGETVLDGRVLDFLLVPEGNHGWELLEKFGFGVTSCRIC